MVMRHAPYPEEQVLAVTIDIEALRRHRTHTIHNCWVDVRTEGFRQIYERSIYPPNRFPSGRPPRSLSDKVSICKEVFDDLYARGQFTPPRGYGPGDVSELLDQRIRYAQETGRLKGSEEQ